MTEPGFFFVTCQIGAEAAVKGELARDWPALRFAYSRPGFLTFKLSGEHGLDDRCMLGSVFARAAAFSLGKATGETVDQRARRVWELAGPTSVDRLHVWQRDLFSPERRTKTEVHPAIVLEAQAAICGCAPPGPEAAAALTAATRAGDMALDCVLVEPDEWWVGCHRSSGTASSWPGGLFLEPLPPHAVSRAYLKMEEALAWSQLPVQPADWCAEIGSAPGGSSQALLDRGLHVIGIDPADMDPRVTANPNFEHWKKRGADVRRREFRKVRWLTADMNVAPQYTLDTVEAIVTHREVNVEGLLLTLKLMDGAPALAVPEYLERVRSWGYRRVEARQLHHNRHDFCLAATTGRPRRKNAARAGHGRRGRAKPRASPGTVKVARRG